MNSCPIFLSCSSNYVIRGLLQHTEHVFCSWGGRDIRVTNKTDGKLQCQYFDNRTLSVQDFICSLCGLREQTHTWVLCRPCNKCRRKTLMKFSWAVILMGCLSAQSCSFQMTTALRANHHISLPLVFTPCRR